MPIDPDEPAMATLTVMPAVSQAGQGGADRCGIAAPMPVARGLGASGRYLTQGSITSAA